MIEHKTQSDTEPIYAVLIDCGYREENHDNWPSETLEETLGGGGVGDHGDYNIICVASGPDWTSVKEAFEKEEQSGHNPMLVTRIPTKATHTVEAEVNEEPE